jgi:hypothetical protein
MSSTVVPGTREMQFFSAWSISDNMDSSVV